MKDDMPSVIITKEGNPVGIITRNDMLSKLFFQKVNIEETTAGNIMASPLITICFNQNVLEAYELMRQKGIKGLIVLKDDKILGRIRLGDIENLAFVSPITVFYRVGCFLIGVLVTLAVIGMTLML
jgi:signal-transduction protein with cAMP-binding, CBS, and nucleotidyltransferase domain